MPGSLKCHRLIWYSMLSLITAKHPPPPLTLQTPPHFPVLKGGGGTTLSKGPQQLAQNPVPVAFLPHHHDKSLPCLAQGPVDCLFAEIYSRNAMSGTTQA